MQMQFKKATKTQARLRLALIGPSGSGKTYSALAIGQHLGDRVAVIDTERGSASKYADLFAFDTLELTAFSPVTYVEAIHAAEAAGYNVLVIDSLSHAWMGKGGALEQVDMAAKRNHGNSYVAWRDVTPMHNALIDAMLASPCHIIVTMRSKTEYVLEKDERTGKTAPKKVGMAPIQRDGMEYEFDVVADMDQENNMIVSKSRCPSMSGQVVNKPGEQVAASLKAWLTDGAPEVKQTPTNGNGNGNGKTTTTPPPPPPQNREAEILDEDVDFSDPAIERELTETPAPVMAMSLDTAENVKNSKGVRYGDLDNETLSGMTNGINKGLKKTGLTEADREEYKMKLDAIGVILKSRNGNN